MPSNQARPNAQQPDSAVIAWLLDSDPSIRWQVLRDLLDAPPEQVAAERARIANEGWGAQLLALQGSDGSWAGVAFNQECNSTMHVLTLLREFGLDPTSDAAQQAMDRVRSGVTWRGWDWDGSWHGLDFPGNPFFAGETEACINGQVGASGAYFGQDIQRIIERLLAEQLPDGGWNCEAPNGSTRSSFNTTICVLEALLEYELAGGNNPQVTAARLRGQEYFLQRHMLRSLSTGKLIECDREGQTRFRHLAFPTWWHYDVLRGLEYLRRAGVTPDVRLAEAVDLIASRRDSDGRWPLETRYSGEMPIELGELEGRPSRWNTLRALRVLKWYADTDRPIISVMLAVPDTPAAVAWYQRALGASLLWSLGSVAGLEIAGAPFFLGEPANNGWESPASLGITSARIEVFCDDPDTLIARALAAGADGNRDPIRDHQVPWGTLGIFGHTRLVILYCAPP